MSQNKESDAAKKKRQERLETFLFSGLALHVQSLQERVMEELDAVQDVIEKKVGQSAKKK